MNLACFIGSNQLNLYILKIKKCVGGKHSKLCLTGLASANTIGKKLPMFIIGKAKLPRCFKNVKHLPCHYFSQEKNWMDGTLFEECVCEIDWQFMKEGQKIVLLVDNCPAHPTIDYLINRIDLSTTKHYLKAPTDGPGRK